jgi:peptidoglycan/LPS O-acetylase OafA/YrhL
MDLPGRFRRQPWIFVHFAVAAVVVFLAFSLRTDSGSVMPLAFAVMGLLPVLAWLAAWWHPTILENSCCAYLGDISYTIYLLHLPLAILLQKPLRLMLQGPEISSIALKSQILSLTASGLRFAILI